MYEAGGELIETHPLVAPRTGRFTVLDSKVST
jgi:Fe-S-cluster formation regulator IscX/YfhJ